MTTSRMKRTWDGERQSRKAALQSTVIAAHDADAQAQLTATKRKIVFLIDMFMESGGTEHHLLQLAAGLDRQRYDVTICPIHKDNTVMTQMARAQGIRVIPFPLKRLYGISVIARTIQLARFLRRNDVDILQTYHFVSDVWGSFTAKLAGVPLVISSRRDKGFKENRLHRMLRNMTRSCIDVTVTVSDDLSRQVMQKELLAVSSVFTAQNGVEPFRRLSKQQIALKRKELGIKEDAIVIGSVMNFRPIKGIDYLVEAAAAVCQRFPQALFVCIGGGANDDSQEYAKRLVQHIESLQLTDHFVFLGKRLDVREILQTFDHFVLPSLSEGFSNALIEAMHAGKSIVATRVGGNPEAITSGEHGLLVPPADAAALAGALSELLANQKQAQRMGRNAQQRAEDLFTTDHMISRYDQIYSQHTTQPK